MLKLPNKMVDGQPTKQDADDFIKNFGPDAFERLLSGSENGIEFRIAEVAGKFDLSDDRQRVAYAEEVSGVLAGWKTPWSARSTRRAPPRRRD